MEKIMTFLNRLEKVNIYYKLSKSRDFSITVTVDVPGERWEVDFLFENEENKNECSGVWVEKFISDGIIFDEKEIEVLFENFSD